MITAAQARELTARSEANVERLLALMEPQIVKAADAGKDFVAVFVDGLDSSVPLYGARFQPTPVQTSVINRLQALGFKAHMAAVGSSYVPRGMQDDDGNGPEYINYTVIVNW